MKHAASQILLKDCFRWR